MSREGYVDKRGSSRDRKVRRAWLLASFDDDLDDGHARCRLRIAADCPIVVDAKTLSVDRIIMGGSYERANIQPACKPCQDKQGGLEAAKTNALMIDEYRAARDGRESLRESGAAVPSSVAGASHSELGYYQLSDDEFDEHVPRVTFREWLIEWGNSRREA